MFMLVRMVCASNLCSTFNHNPQKKDQMKNEWKAPLMA